ncbi:MAG TPA: MBL fold metallo-hydrolase, partial [Syntrophomonadaceae bacterium]|nr:MBL fold metallo-hydrolase [Syntrophomonadaceae bacterium]
SKSFDDLLTALENKNLKINTARAGITLPLASVNAYFLAPVKDYYEDLNNYSAVIKIVCGNKVFLFMGDAEKEAEDDMLAAGTDLKADVLKVGHHGSDSGTSTAFLNLVQPQYAIISVGEDNPYGHPHQETLNRLQECGSQIMRTDLNGTIVIHTDGNKLDIVIEKGE